MISRFNALDQDFTASRRRKILIIGDSFAGDLVNAIDENNALPKDEIRTFYIPRECQIRLPPHDTPRCRKFAIDSPVAQTRIKNAEVVILSARWEVEAASQAKLTMKRAGILPGKKLIVLGSKDFGAGETYRPIAFLNLSQSQRLAYRNPVSLLPENAILAKAFGPSIFADPEQILCRSHVFCAIFLPDGKLISFDGRHFTPEGASFAGQRLFDDAAPLRELRSSPGQ